MSGDYIKHERIVSADAHTAVNTHYDIILIGSGILGSALAYSLANSGRSILLVERDLSEPDRIVGELLQPGGCIALKKMGIQDCLEGIDATRVLGYQVYWGQDQVELPYPAETTNMSWGKEELELSKLGLESEQQEGRSFHHGRFVQNLRRKASEAKGVTLIEATVSELRENDESRIIGITAKPKFVSGSSEKYEGPLLEYSGDLTIVTDGCFSKFRKDFLPAHIATIVRSNFVSLELIDPVLPAPYHGHVILRKPALPSAIPTTEKAVGPVLVYQLATHETRMLIDVPGIKLPSQASGQLHKYLMNQVAPILPPTILPSFLAALEKSTIEEGGRLRSMPNSYLPASVQGRRRVGGFLAGDSMNMRHPLTGGGMTVGLNDAVILTSLLGGGISVGSVEGDSRGVIDLKNGGDWDLVRERLEEWHWKRKGIATCINTLAQALYSLFGADDANLEVLKTGCFKYFELGGEAIAGPVSLLSAITPSPLLLIYHFFSVAIYSIYILFTAPRYDHSPISIVDDDSSFSSESESEVIEEKLKPIGIVPGFAEYPALTIQSTKVFWAAVVVLLPVLWSESQM